jgi:hypothetical protein
MRRIIVVGCQGSGKTSLALRLGRNLGLPVVHLDVLYWRPGWKESDKAGFRGRRLGVDGSFSGRVFDLTLARADTHIGRIRPARLWRVLRARQCRAAEIDQNLCMALRESARAYWLTVVHAQP